MASHPGSDGLAQCCELLGQPMHPLHASACAQLDVWEAERADELCLALAHLVWVGQNGVADATRQLAAIALKNAISRRWQALGTGTVTGLREAAIGTLRASNPLVRSGGAALVESLASFGWPGLAESLIALCGDDDVAVDGALRAIDALASNSDNERPRRRRLRIAWPADDSERYRLSAAIARHFEHASAAVRQRAVRCARLVGWVDREAEGVVIAALAAPAFDGDAGVREEVLRALRTLAPRLDKAALTAVAEHAIISLADPETRVAKRAAELWHDLARLGRDSAAGSLHALVPALLRAMRYTVDDISSFAAEAQVSTLAFPDRPEDVRPGRDSPSSDEDSLYGEDGDEENDLDDDDDRGDYDDGSWTLRTCAAAALDALARVHGSLLLDAALPHIARALEGEHTQSTESTMGPRGGDAPASTPSGVWEREAALLALGAISDGCCLGLRPHAASVAPFLLAQLENPIPQVREIVAWVIARGSTKWFFSFSLADRRRRMLAEDSCTTVSTKEDEPLLAACIEALLKVLCVDEHKRVLESATAAAAAIFHVACDAARPYARAAAAILAASISRFQLRARLEVYEAAVTLASRVGIDGDARLALLGPLEARWQEEATDPSRNLDASWPFLECFRAMARTEKATCCHDTALIYERAVGRCVLLVRAADAALADESLTIDHARAAAGIGAFALDLIASLAHALGGDRLVGVVATSLPGWAVVDVALRLINTCDYNDDEYEVRSGTAHMLNIRRQDLCRPARAARDVQRTALASAAAILLGELATVAPDRVTADVVPALVRDSRSQTTDTKLLQAASMLTVIAAPMRCQRDHDLAPEMSSLRNAVSLASQNASWVVGTLAVQVESMSCGRLESLVADAARVLVALLKSRNAQLASHAAIVLGRCASRTELFGPVSAYLCPVMIDWLRAIARIPRGADTHDLQRCFAVICSVARTRFDALTETTAALAFVAALAVWRRCDPPVPPATLALALKRILHELRARGSLRQLDAGTATILQPEDAQYISRLYG